MPRPYLETIHDALEQAQLEKDKVLFNAAVNDALLIHNLELLYAERPSATHPNDL